MDMRLAPSSACAGSSTEDGTGFTDGASHFEKTAFEKGAQPSAIENTAASMLQHCGAARIYIFSRERERGGGGGVGGKKKNC
jgi:hypothetical protein